MRLISLQADSQLFFNFDPKGDGVLRGGDFQMLATVYGAPNMALGPINLPLGDVLGHKVNCGLFIQTSPDLVMFNMDLSSLWSR